MPIEYSIISNSLYLVQIKRMSHANSSIVSARAFVFFFACLLVALRVSVVILFVCTHAFTSVINFSDLLSLSDEMHRFDFLLFHRRSSPRLWFDVNIRSVELMTVPKTECSHKTSFPLTDSIEPMIFFIGIQREEHTLKFFINRFYLLCSSPLFYIVWFPSYWQHHSKQCNTPTASIFSEFHSIWSHVRSFIRSVARLLILSSLPTPFFNLCIFL